MLRLYLISLVGLFVLSFFLPTFADSSINGSSFGFGGTEEEAETEALENASKGIITWEKLCSEGEYLKSISFHEHTIKTELYKNNKIVKMKKHSFWENIGNSLVSERRAEVPASGFCEDF